MQIKRSKNLGKIILLSVITLTSTYANDQENLSHHQDEFHRTSNTPYQSMTTAQLQEEVEKRSIHGDLAFEMGIELMNRWTKGQPST